MPDSVVQFGYRISADLLGVKLDTSDGLALSVRKAVARVGSHIRGLLHVPFEPQGDTMAWVIDASHIVIHTWPEHEALTIDVFACGGREAATVILAELVGSIPHTQKTVYHG